MGEVMTTKIRNSYDVRWVKFCYSYWGDNKIVENHPIPQWYLFFTESTPNLRPKTLIKIHYHAISLYTHHAPLICGRLCEQKTILDCHLLPSLC